MKRKLFALTALLGLVAFGSSIPRAEAVVYCNVACPSSPTNRCACPRDSSRPGAAVYCYDWEAHCY
jgi:hypothetical protein